METRYPESFSQTTPILVFLGCGTTVKLKDRRATRTSDQRPKILKLVKENLSAEPEEIAAKLFPSISRDSKEFVAKTRLVKKVFPSYLRDTRWHRKSIWATEGRVDPELFMRLSIVEQDGRKIIGGRSDPCKCVVTSEGSILVRVYHRFWRGWLIQQLINFGWSKEIAEKNVMNLQCHSKISEVALKVGLILRKLGEFAVHDSDTGLTLKVGNRRLGLELAPELAGLLQNSRDNDDQVLNKLRSLESSEVVLASVSALRIDRVFQGLGLNPRQVNQASDNLVTLGVEDRRPDFIYLVYGPPSAKPRQVGVRALITTLPNYQIDLTYR